MTLFTMVPIMPTQQGETLYTRNEKNEIINFFLCISCINKLREWEVRIYSPNLLVNRDHN